MSNFGVAAGVFWVSIILLLILPASTSTAFSFRSTLLSLAVRDSSQRSTIHFWVESSESSGQRLTTLAQLVSKPRRKHVILAAERKVIKLVSCQMALDNNRDNNDGGSEKNEGSFPNPELGNIVPNKEDDSIDGTVTTTVDNNNENSSSSSCSSSSLLGEKRQGRQKSTSPSQQQRTILSNQELMKALGTSPRRIFISLTSSIGIALAANLFGVTSGLLSVIPENIVESTRLDEYFPRGEYKRYRGEEYGYTFVFPKEWVADTAVELVKAQRRAKTLDYTMKRSSTGQGVLPDAAFGPPGKLNSRGVSQSDTNVSVIASQVMPGFTLRGTLGTPQNAAETLLRVSLAPEGSGRVATLLSARDERRDESDIYQFEYTIDRGEKGVPLRAISVIAERNGDTLITLTVVASAQDWADPVYDAKLRRVAESFKLTR